MASPSLLALQVDRLIQQVNLLRTQGTHSVSGARLADGDTTQGGGDATAPNIDIDAGGAENIVINGVAHNPVVATADVDVSAGVSTTTGWLAAGGVSCIYAVFLKSNAANTATVTYGTLNGAIATTGAQIAPTDAAITTAVTHANWVRVGDVTATRTGATTITFAASYANRPAQKLQALGDLATSEATFV